MWGHGLWEDNEVYQSHEAMTEMMDAMGANMGDMDGELTLDELSEWFLDETGWALGYEDEQWEDDIHVWQQIFEAFFINDGDNWNGANAEENLVEMLTTFFGVEPDADTHALAQDLLDTYDNGAL